MSDFFVSVIPADPTWQPTAEAATAAADYLRSVFPDPDGVIQEITVNFHDRITAIDAGENLVRITCPDCGSDIALDWYADLLEQTDAEFDDLATTAPCCHRMTTLDRLDYDQPCGFARFEIAIANPVRPELELNPQELATTATFLGRPVRQILAHI